MIEKEYKALLSRDKFLKLKSRIKDVYKSAEAKEFRQINYYYDTEDFSLYESRRTLRVRLIEGKYLMQFKQELEADGLNKVSKELEKEIDYLPDIIESAFDIDFDSPARLIGSLETSRESIFPRPGVRIDMDISSYLGSIDYEIEVEYESSLPKDIIDMLEDSGSVLTGKYSRFIDKAKLLRKEE